MKLRNYLIGGTTHFKFVKSLTYGEPMPKWYLVKKFITPVAKVICDTTDQQVLAGSLWTISKTTEAGEDHNVNSIHNISIFLS